MPYHNQQHHSMTGYILVAFASLVAASFNTFGQTNVCKIKIIRLEFDKSQQLKTGEVTDSLLALAKLTNSILVNNSDIMKFDIKTDSFCCMYAGQMFVTTHRYLLKRKAVSKLSALAIPLCCGIPVAFYVEDKEIYRAMLWNVLSSFSNKSKTVILKQNTLTVTNELPIVPDFRNNILVNKNLLPDCLTNKKCRN